MNVREELGSLIVPFLRLIEESPVEEVPRLLGELEWLKAKGYARLLPAKATPSDEPDRMLTMPEVAALLGITEHQAREMGRRGELPVLTVGERFVRVRAGALEEWIRRREGATLSRPKGR